MAGLLKEVVAGVGSGLVGLYMKGVLAGEVFFVFVSVFFAISRN